ncbi:MAG: hypothetical protein FDZ69_12315 [Deltaproteobacteria bacterium]|nr:MAG: hypothetical protein FDZ69_12315 [Deltaproteobacteria bacterium]
MTEPRRYVIRRAFVLPLALVLLLMGVLLVVSIRHGQPAAKVAFLLVFALPVAALFVESAFRRIEIDADGVTAVRPFRSRRLDFARVTALESVRVRSRVFLTLSAGSDEFLIVSNGYADFPDLVRTLIAALPAEAVTEEARQLAAAPPRRHSDLVMVWFMVAALVYVLVAQFRS